MIRKYTAGDLDELLEVWYEASLIATPFLTPGFLARERIDIEETYLPITETWVYEDDGRVVGFVAMIENVVGALFVMPQKQRRGIGKALLDHVRPSHDQLEVEVFEKNEIGHAFYARYGFQPAGSRMHDETGLVMSRLTTVIAKAK